MLGKRPYVKPKDCRPHSDTIRTPFIEMLSTYPQEIIRNKNGSKQTIGHDSATTPSSHDGCKPMLTQEYGWQKTVDAKAASWFFT